MAEPTEADVANQGILDALQAQRNAALTNEAKAYGHIAVLERRLQELQQKLDACSQQKKQAVG